MEFSTIYWEKNIFGFLDNHSLIQFTHLGIITIFTESINSYLYDPNLYQNHKFLKPYIDALNLGGTVCQDLIKHSMYLREEDYIPSQIGFVPTKGIQDKEN